MKYRATALLSIVLLAIMICSFSLKKKYTRQEHKVITEIDSIRKDTIPADSLQTDSIVIAGKHSFHLFKKNAHASYYADRLHGKRTASGKKYDREKFTAAHKKFPFGTQLKITNLANSSTVIVVVNDRGPFTKGRDIDLSKAAFKQINNGSTRGPLRVKIEVVKEL